MGELELIETSGYLAIGNGVMLLLWLLVGLLLRWVVRRALGGPPAGMRRAPWLQPAEGAGWALLVLFVCVASAAVLGGYSQGDDWQAFPDGGTTPSLAVVWLFFGLQSLAEELLFRALVMTLGGLALFGLVLLMLRLAERQASAGFRLRAWVVCGFAANTGVAVVFGLVHMTNPNADLVGIVNIVFAGLALGQLQWNRGSVLAPWVMHWVWNASITTLGLPISGIRLDPPLPSLAIEGARDGVLTGGQFGPEASVLCGVGLAVVAVLLAIETVAVARRVPLTETSEAQTAPDPAAREAVPTEAQVQVVDDGSAGGGVES
jgi:membrane protease YdiL (CAAX protease family)